jgi:RNA polymerase sigma-70 factor (ECF subfamily)
MKRSDDPDSLAADPGQFPSTHWSIVLQAQGRTSLQAGEALAHLCRVYWYPLYAFIRRHGEAHEAAQDLTQEFFARLLEKDFLASVERHKGKFRAFLLACCKHFLANQHDRAKAQKRGGGRAPLPLDFVSAEERYRREPADRITPEKLYERRWALALLEQVLEWLRQEYADAGKGPLYDRLKGALTAGADALPYAEVAAVLQMSEAAVKKAAQRLRGRYRDLLRAEIAATVETPEQVDEEIRELFGALGG